MKLIARKTRRSTPLAAAALLGAVLATSAASKVTFQVDMNVAATNGTFNPTTQTVSTHGSFNNWDAFPLTNNPAGANPMLYSGTTNLPSNGIVIAYKYVIEPGANYETTATHNRFLDLPTNDGGNVTAPLAFYSDIPPDGTLPTTVTFQVNLAQQINVGSFNPSTSFVFARGTWNNFAADVAMTNDPSIRTTNQFGLVNSNVYVSTYDIAGSPGKSLDFKFYIDTGANWESLIGGLGIDSSDNNNRYFNLASSGPQKLPILFFNNLPYSPLATNSTTFQVDMTAQVTTGKFDPTVGTVELRGNFNGWGPPGGTQILLTNNPAGPNTNLYSTVVPIADGIGANEFYKFWASVAANGGWETFANNRSLTVVAGNTHVLPVASFNDEVIGDFLPADTLVTFTISMTNAVGTDSHAFDPANDHVYVNGIPIFVSWDSVSLSGFELTNNPVGSKLYSLTILIPQFSPVRTSYKYSINGTDNEAGNGVNHIRYIRQTGTYSLPLDTFGTMTAEISFGNFKAGPAVAGHVPLSWLGRPGVHLQSRTSLSTGSWVDVPGTDGLSATNYPISGAIQFFRLIKPYP